MCSRHEHKRNEAKIKLRDQIRVFGVVPRANIRPTDLGPIILPDEDSFACREMRWGWSVTWDKSPLINAKSETLSQLATFKPHLDRRCLLLADGFYEKGVLFRQPGGSSFCLAGLWREEPALTEIPRSRERERMSAGQVRAVGEKQIVAEGHKGEVSKLNQSRCCFVMLTTTPNATVAPYHQRMPLILPPRNFDAWLGDDWQHVLAEPDHSPLEIVQKQPELF